jgi:hypothetical protein
LKNLNLIVLYGSEIWEEYTLGCLTKMFGLKREAGEKFNMRSFRLPHCSKCCYDHHIKYEMCGHVPYMIEMRNAYRILIGQPKWKRQLGRPLYR